MRSILLALALIPMAGCSVFSLLPKEKEIIVEREIHSCPLVLPVMICKKASRFQIPDNEREARLKHLLAHRQSSCKDKYIAIVHKHAKECRKRERRRQ